MGFKATLGGNALQCRKHRPNVPHTISLFFTSLKYRAKLSLHQSSFLISLAKRIAKLFIKKQNNKTKKHSSPQSLFG